MSDELIPPEDDDELASASAETLSPEEAERKARSRRRLQELDELSPPYRDTTVAPGFKLAAMLLLAVLLLGGFAMLGHSLIQAIDRYNQRLDRMAAPP